jgi:hypothetical protein
MFAWGNGHLGTGEETQSAATPIRLWDLDGHRITSILYISIIIFFVCNFRLPAKLYMLAQRVTGRWL